MATRVGDYSKEYWRIACKVSNKGTYHVCPQSRLCPLDTILRHWNSFSKARHFNLLLWLGILPPMRFLTQRFTTLHLFSIWLVVNPLAFTISPALWFTTSCERKFDVGREGGGVGWRSWFLDHRRGRGGGGVGWRSWFLDHRSMSKTYHPPPPPPPPTTTKTFSLHPPPPQHLNMIHQYFIWQGDKVKKVEETLVMQCCKVA